MRQKSETYCFYEDSLLDWGIDAITVAENSQGDLYFQFRPICEALQLQRSKQNAFIQTDSRTRAGAEQIKAPSNGGIQETLFPRKRETAIWLAILDPEHVNGMAKGRLREFQDALWSLADRSVFKRRRSTEAGAEDAGRVVPLTGDLHGEFICESGIKHVFVFESGVLRVYDR